MQLLKHFHELSLHPKNAKELKGLILHLAVQGKLTEQWRKENRVVEPAKILLEILSKKKAKLIAEKKIKKDKPLPSIADIEIPFMLPKKWEWSYIGEIGQTNIGLTYSPKEITDDGTIVLRSSNIQKGKLSFNDIVRVTKKLNPKVIVNEGDLLICARNGSRKLVGKCAIIEGLNEIAAFGAFMAVFRSNFNDYIKLFIESPIYRSRLEGVETTTINQITQGNLKSTLIPFPPLEEQKAIVKVVEQLFVEAEQLEQLTEKRIQLKEQFAVSALHNLTTNDTVKEWVILKPHFHTFFNEEPNIKKLRETILQLAVQGKLTAHWRTIHSPFEGGQGDVKDHDAAYLLNKIKAEKARLVNDGKIKKEKPLPPISDDEIPYELPGGWVWCRLQDLVSLLGDGIHGTPEYTINGEYHFINGNNLSDGIIEIKTNTKTVSKEESLKHKRDLNERTVLVSINGTIGNTAFYNDEKVMLGKSACYFNLLNNIDKSYIRLLIKTNYFLDYAFSEATGTTIKNVSLRTMRSFIVPFPPLKEQKAIVETVNRLMVLCDQLEEQVSLSKQQVEDWMKGSLKEVEAESS